jgi:hypothetical protein
MTSTTTTENRKSKSVAHRAANQFRGLIFIQVKHVAPRCIRIFRRE